MKKLLLIMSATALLFNSCTKDPEPEPEYKTYPVSVQLIYPAESGFKPIADIKVVLKNNITGTEYDIKTTDQGIAKFDIPEGVYVGSTTDIRPAEHNKINMFNGTTGTITVTATWNEDTPAVELNLVVSETSQLIIKELYNGGCQKDDDSGAFQADKYVIIYNNSEQPASLDNLCLGMVAPYNGEATNNDYIDNKLFYEAEGWIPAGQGIWTLPQTGINLDPGKQIVIALTGAINHTATYSNSVNLANPEYYCTYDIEVYPNANHYPAPDASIPASHYLKAYHYGAGNAWSLSVLSPAFFIFKTDGTTPEAFVNDPTKVNYHGGNESAAHARRKVPVEWIMDGIEVWNQDKPDSQKRLTPSVDAGYVKLSKGNGYTLYRNVNVAATQAIEGNKDKLVYNYDLGTVNVNGTTDPSGIDAEASIKNGARIIYQDTNNSSNDYHQRRIASIKQ